MVRGGGKYFLEGYTVICRKCHLCQIMTLEEEIYEGFELTARSGH